MQTVTMAHAEEDWEKIAGAWTAKNEALQAELENLNSQVATFDDRLSAMDVRPPPIAPPTSLPHPSLPLVL